MTRIRNTSALKLTVVILTSFIFFIAEISVGFKSGSLALVADAFHYLNDFIGFVVALSGILISQRNASPKEFSFGWARASLIGAFFNGAFLLALGISIVLQSMGRFISIQHITNPKMVLIMGCIGLTLNILSMCLLHEHHGHGDDGSHSPAVSYGDRCSYDYKRQPISIGLGLTRKDDSGAALPMMPINAHANHRHNILKLSASGRHLGMLGALIHVIGDAANNIGVIIAALVIWLTSYEARFYADPGVSVGIGIMILVSSLPLITSSGTILMQSAPRNVQFDDVKHDLESARVESIHELHIWRLDQTISVASAHIVVASDNMSDFMECAATIKECFHAYGIHSITLQPEIASPRSQISNAHATSVKRDQSVSE
ncbi:cation efflux system protein czcD [Xylariales sp. PMI_506]|nr:cation efflux system protein czcD [Xylariales sp. PMI_506]